jgi:hypothetical protein
MFVVMYNKSSKKITGFRRDLSVPQVCTAQYYFDDFLESNGASNESHAFAEIPYSETNGVIVIGNHVFNESTQTVEADPNYVPPVDPIPVEPTPAEPAK